MASLPITKTHLERLLAARGWSRTLVPSGPATGAGSAARPTAITVFYPAGGGVTSAALAMTAEALAQPAAVAAWVDGADALDPAAAGAMGVDLERLLWLRAAAAVLPDLLAMTQMLIASARFRLIVLDLLSRPMAELGRLPQAAWFRLLRGLERHRRGQLLVLAPELPRMPTAIQRMAI